MNTRKDLQYIQPNLNENEEITIANWNLKIFGDSKAKNTDLMLDYAGIMRDYDIIFIQEIRDKDGSAFNSLCLFMGDYECKISSRAGRSSSKEQYGIIYKKDINIIDFLDYNPDAEDRWERPPIKVTFNDSGYVFTVYNIHTKPTDAENEIAYLDDIVQDQGNVIITGDLNADCDYYEKPMIPDFGGWEWLIEDNEDTTVGSTDCAYDRIILNDNAYDEYISHEIRTDITEEMSDHYLVSVTLKKEE